MIQENAFGNVFWKMAAISSWPQCVNMLILTVYQEECDLYILVVAGQEGQGHTTAVEAQHSL